MNSIIIITIIIIIIIIIVIIIIINIIIIIIIRNIRPKYLNVNFLFSIVWCNEIYLL